MDPSELLALKNLWRMCQAARDAYGPAEDYLVSMENRLEAEEAKLDQIEERLYQKLDLSRPAPTVKSPLEDQDKEVSKDENNDESSRQSSHESRSADQNDFENYLWRLRNLDLLHGRYHGLLNEKSILEEEKLNRRRVGMELDTEYIEVLDHFEEILEPERKEIKDVAEDVECLKKLCIEKGFMDADGNPIQPLATDQAPGSDSVEDVQAERLPEYIMPSQHQEPLRHDEMDSRVLISNEGFGPFINLWPLHKLRSSTMEMLLLACYVAPSVHNMDGLKWQAEAFRLWERDSVMKEVPGEIYDAVESNMSPSIHRYVEEKTKRDEGKKALVELATYADCYIMRIRLGYHEKGWIISTWNTKSAFYVASPVRFLNHFERGLVLAACIQFIDGAAALPTGPLPETGNARTSIGFTGFWKTKAKQFTDETAGPLLLNMCLILVLTVVHVIIMRLHRGLCKDWDLLLTSMIATSLGLVFLAMVESLSGWQVAILWVFSASFLIRYLREKFVNLRLSGINAVSIVTLGIGATSLLATYADFRGRLADPVVLVSVAALPAITFLACLWVAFLHQTKVIHSIEDGTYVKPVLEFSKDVYNAIRIWHTRQPLDAPTSSLDLEAQTQRMKGKKFTTSVEKAKQDDKRLPSVDETINPVQRGILRNAKSTKRQNQRKPTNQRQRSGNRIHLHNSTSPNVEGLEKKKWS